MLRKKSKWFRQWERKFELDSCRFMARQWAFGYVPTNALIKALQKFQRLTKGR